MKYYNNDEQIESLIDRFEEMLENEDSLFLDADLFEQIIIHYQQEEAFNKAFTAANLAITRYSYSSIFYLLKAQLNFKLGEWEESLNLIEKATVYDIGDSELYIQKAEIYSKLDQFEFAHETLDHAATLIAEKDLDIIHLKRASIYEHMDRYDLAFREVVKSLKINPKNIAGLERIFLITEITENYRKSIALHLEVIDEDPYSYLAWYNLGHAYMNLKMYDEAVDAFEFVIAIDDKFELAYIDCADVYLKKGCYEKAIELHNEYISLFDPDCEVYTKSGLCYEKLGQLDVAKSLYLKAICLEPENDLPHFRIGKCHAQEGEWVKAINCYKRAIELNENGSDYYTALGIAYFQREEIELAEKMLAIACDMAPHEYHKWIQYAIFLQEIDMAENALEVIEEAFLYCDSMCLYYCKAACLFALGKRKEGFEILIQALTYDLDECDLLFECMPTLKEDSEIVGTVAEYRAA